ncbi:MAG: hypothetical protein AB7C91_13180 [Sphaerochaeta sp.]|uniref:hypothetical protein n=1 Tax=Sphaerochaeta sp. TaxID=1972642 RepID=UPI003D0BD795
MQEKELDSEIHGFRDVFFSQGWRVSYADYDPQGNDLSCARRMEKHLETEEAFYLLKGRVCLVTAGSGKVLGPLEAHPLEDGRLYIVGKGEWHLGIFHPGAAVLIVENEKESCSESLPLSPKDLADLKKIFA